MHQDQGSSDTFCQGKSCNFLEMAKHEPATLVKLHAEFKWVITPLVSVPSSVAAEPHASCPERHTAVHADAKWHLLAAGVIAVAIQYVVFHFWPL
jgi:hypothetical protein